jgi:hypothetical protein
MGFDKPAEATMYVPHGDVRAPDDAYVWVRTIPGADRTAAEMSAIFRAFDRNMLATVQMLPDALADTTRPPRCQGMLFGGFSGLALVLAGGGVAIGFAGSLAASRFLRGILYGVTPWNPVTYLLVGLVLLAVSMLACLLPMRRALAVDPAVALRAE